MSIAFKCPCGRSFLTADEYAGRKAKCPDCGAGLVVPTAVMQAPAAAAAPRSLPPPLPDAEPVAARNAPAEYDGIQKGRGTPAPRRAYDDRDERPYCGGRRDPYDDRIVDRIRRRSSPPPAAGGWTDKGVLAGLGMIAGGVVITIVGLYVGFIVYVGPILFIAGIISVIKGAANGRV